MVLSDFIFILIVFDIYSFYFYFNVYLLYVAHVSYIIKRIWYGMAWYLGHVSIKFEVSMVLRRSPISKIVATRHTDRQSTRLRAAS